MKARRTNQDGSRNGNVSTSGQFPCRTALYLLPKGLSSSTCLTLPYGFFSLVIHQLLGDFSTAQRVSDILKSQLNLTRSTSSYVIMNTAFFGEGLPSVFLFCHPIDASVHFKMISTVIWSTAIQTFGFDGLCRAFAKG